MLQRNTLLLLLSAVILCVAITGCGSGGDSPVSPTTTQERIVESGGSGHVLWGMFNVAIDPGTLEAEIVPIRGAMFTANVTQFMQPPSSPIQLLSIEIDPFASNPSEGLIVCDVTLQHPFPGSKKLRGFDVRGVCMGDGTPGLDYDPDATYPVDEDTILMNADGYTRWFNIWEFGPDGTIFAYTKGALSPSGYLPLAVLNGYKVFADELEAADPVILDPANRGTFSVNPGINTRRYEIQFPFIGGSPAFNFAYAIAANWAMPDPSGIPDYPVDSFPPEANSAEAYLVTVTDAGSTAWYVHDGDNGGFLKLDIEVFDWQAPYNPSGVPGELAGLWFEGEVVDSPVDLLSIATVLPGSETSSVFNVEIYGLNLTHSGPNEIWIIAENADPNTYEPQIDGDTSTWTWPDSPLTAYLRTTIDIADMQPQFAPVVTAIDPDKGKIDNIVNATVTGNHFADGCEVVLRESGGMTFIDAENVTWVDETEVTCDLDLTGANLGLYDVVVINPSTLEGQLDEGFEVIMVEVIYVDDSNESGIEDGTMDNPFDTIQEGLAAAESDDEVWVDDSGNPYDGPVTLVSGVVLKSVNWDDSDGDAEATILGGSPCVVGAEGATIEGFEVNGGMYGIECNGVSTDIIDCRVVNLSGSGASAIWLHDGSHAHLNGVEVDGITNGDHETCYGILVQDCEAVGDEKVIIEHTTVHNMPEAQWDSSHGIYISNSAGIQLDQCDVYDIHGGTWGSARGICISGSDGAQLTTCTVYEIYGKDYSYPYGILISGSQDVEINHCVVHTVSGGNYSTSKGIWISESDNALIFNSIVHDVYGSNYDVVYGIKVTNSAGVELTNNVIYEIRKYGSGCGGYGQVYGLYFTGCTDLDARNLIITHIHTAYASQQAYGVGGGTDTYIFDYCDVYNCSTALYQNVDPGPNCISQYPKYVNAGTDFHLDTGSPCINTGDPAINDPDGSHSDMGAYGGPGGDW